MLWALKPKQRYGKSSDHDDGSDKDAVWSKKPPDIKETLLQSSTILLSKITSLQGILEAVATWKAPLQNVSKKGGKPGEAIPYFT